MQATKKAPSFTRERFHTFLLTKNLLFSHDIIKVQFMNSNHYIMTEKIAISLIWRRKNAQV